MKKANSYIILALMMSQTGLSCGFIPRSLLPGCFSHRENHLFRAWFCKWTHYTNCLFVPHFTTILSLDVSLDLFLSHTFCSLRSQSIAFLCVILIHTLVWFLPFTFLSWVLWTEMLFKCRQCIFQHYFFFSSGYPWSSLWYLNFVKKVKP